MESRDGAEGWLTWRTEHGKLIRYKLRIAILSLPPIIVCCLQIAADESASNRRRALGPRRYFYVSQPIIILIVFVGFG